MTTREKVDKLESELDVASLKVVAFGKSFQIYPWIKGRLFHKIITGNETLVTKNIQLYFNQFLSLFYGFYVCLFRIGLY